jgi:hypothetical protein
MYIHVYWEGYPTAPEHHLCGYCLFVNGAGNYKTPTKRAHLRLSMAYGHHGNIMSQIKPRRDHYFTLTPTDKHPPQSWMNQGVLNTPTDPTQTR